MHGVVGEGGAQVYPKRSLTKLIPGFCSCPSLSSKAACLRGHKEQGELL